MPRKPRMYLPNTPCHVIQRGNNRHTCFAKTDDYHFYLYCLGNACRRYRVSLHAYVLMTNHTHLLMTPSDEEGVSRVMQSLGRRYVQYFNAEQSRTGTLWEGRHKASLIQADSYLLACYRYIELNPVRASMVEDPSEYLWSSYCANALGDSNPIITEHPVYTSLGGGVTARLKNYRALFAEPLDSSTIQNIRIACRSSIPLGDASFKTGLEKALCRPISCAERGRPRIQTISNKAE